MKLPRTLRGVHPRYQVTVTTPGIGPRSTLTLHRTTLTHAQALRIAEDELTRAWSGDGNTRTIARVARWDGGRWKLVEKWEKADETMERVA